MTPSEADKGKPVYRLKFVPDALKEWQTLDGSIKEPLRNLLKKRLEQPHMPGAELHGDLRGCYKIKLRNLIRFLEEGDKTKVTLRFRGREMAHQEFGYRLIERVKNDLEPYSVIEQFPKMEGRQMVMVLSPKKGAVPVARAAPKKAAAKPAAVAPADVAATAEKREL